MLRDRCTSSSYNPSIGNPVTFSLGPLVSLRDRKRSIAGFFGGFEDSLALFLTENYQRKCDTDERFCALNRAWEREREKLLQNSPCCWKCENACAHIYYADDCRGCTPPEAAVHLWLHAGRDECVVANSGLVGLGEGLGVRSRSFYGTQTVVALWQWQCCENSLSRAPSSEVPPRLTLLGFLLRRNRK